MTEVIDISIVIPAYNEEENIADSVNEVRGVMQRVGRPYEIIVVDDGSTDGTFKALAELKARAPELRAVRFARNCGQTAAMEAGFRAARGEIIVTLDADLQNDPANIPELLERMKEFDVVCGVRAKRNDNWVRKLSSRIGNGVRNGLTHESLRDTGCTLKAYRAEYVRKLKLFEGMHRFLPTLLRMTGARVTEIPVNHRPRLRGQAKYGIRNRMFKGLRDCLAVRWMQKRWIQYEVRDELR